MNRAALVLAGGEASETRLPGALNTASPLAPHVGDSSQAPKNAALRLSNFRRKG